MIRAGAFRPAMSEIWFGKPKKGTDSIGEIALALADGREFLLNGRIDRLDIAKIDGQKVAIIFDYKKRFKKSFNWSEFYHGLDIQLAVYMMAVANAAKNIASDIAGAFYLPIEVEPQSAAVSKSDVNNSKFARKARGIFNGDYASILDGSASQNSIFYNFYVNKEGSPYGSYSRFGSLRPDDFNAFMNFVSTRIIDLAGRITSGEITAFPYRLGTDSPCSQCEYRPVCRFDWQINKYNLLDRFNKEQVLELIKANESK